MMIFTWRSDYILNLCQLLFELHRLDTLAASRLLVFNFICTWMMPWEERRNRNPLIKTV